MTEFHARFTATHFPALMLEFAESAMVQMWIAGQLILAVVVLHKYVNKVDQEPRNAGRSLSRRPSGGQL